MYLNPLHWFNKTPVMKRFQKKNNVSLEKVYLDTQSNEYFGFSLTNGVGLFALLNSLFIFSILKSITKEFNLFPNQSVKVYIISAVLTGLIWWIFCESRFQYRRYFKVIRSLSRESKINLRISMIIYVIITAVLVRYYF